jgi:serralysin
MIDTAAPVLVDIWQEASTIRLQLSEPVALGANLKTTDFSVRSGTRSISVAAIRNDATLGGSSEVVLQLSEALSADAVTKLTYSGTNISDGLGNQLSTFNNRTLNQLASEQSITPPAYNFTTLALTGANNVNIQGNNEENRLLGNVGDNILDGGGAADRLTGGLGRDTFRITTLGDALLLNPITGRSGFDIITDLAIGTDIIDGPEAIDSSRLVHRSTAEAFTGLSLTALLPAEALPALGGAVVSFGTNTEVTRTFLVLNDAVAGFSSSSDGLIEITGYSGEINDLRVI